MSRIRDLKKEFQFLRTLQRNTLDMYGTPSNFRDQRLLSVVDQKRMRFINPGTPANPWEKMQKISGEDLPENAEWINTLSSRKRAHLRSERDYNWEMAMRSANSQPNWLKNRRKERKSCFLDMFRRMSMSLPFKKNSKQNKLKIPVIIITEATEDIIA
ncbi:uncharacterized protein LOC113672448 [Pocillopora damicornis]|uniref:uncharacterized protein LOC113672448 n=1 Tax=Pocillopora damicornis TaxID=46731 RepID=UPI000F551325|nr:uncharacterized protein LOC113672448 [Pocillopora damicornis]